MRNILRFSLAALLGLFFGIAPALAQSAGPDEAVQPNGTVRQTVALTAGQRSAIRTRPFLPVFRCACSRVGTSDCVSTPGRAQAQGETGVPPALGWSFAIW